MGLNLIPVELADANAFVEKFHRHHGNVVGHKFSLGAVRLVIREAMPSGPHLFRELVGVSIIGRPVARGRDDGWTLEVTRLCTDGTRNGNLYPRV